MGVCVSSEALMGMRHWILSEAEQGGCHHGVACLGPLKGSRRLSAAPKGTSRESMSLATWIRCVTVRLSIRSAPSLHAPPANRNATPPSSPQPTVATAKRPRKVHAVRYTTAVLSSSHLLVLSSCVCGFSDAVSGVRRALMSTVRCELGFGAFLLRPSCAAAHDLRQDRYSRAMTETEPTAFFRRSQPLASARTLPRLVPRAPSAPNVRRP